MSDSPNVEPKWPERFVEFCRILRSGQDSAIVERARGELWLILNSVLLRHVSYHASRYGGIAREDMEDIAAQKALDLLTRLQSGDLDLSDRDPPQLKSFLSSVAQKGLIDLFRKHNREVHLGDEEMSNDTGRSRFERADAPNPATPVESKAFAKSLRGCAEGLDDRLRTIWIFRVFYEMSSKEIASHPEVRLKPSYVDVILQRVRETLTNCMQNKGHDTRQIPTGVFVELWHTFRLERTGAPVTG